jgi:sulfatase maturation enzyme AslB (radical SAM superfamily)|tara:strand:- start:547 stop:1881 length:1335 start_codon:yes stop_codon:yes gene_type:complete
METPETFEQRYKRLTNSSSSFCPLLYDHATIQTTGKFKLCCVAKDSTSQMSAIDSSNSIADYWNSKTVRASRKMMMNSLYPPECSDCKRLDELNIPSKRSSAVQSMHNNLRYGNYILDRIENSTDSDFNVSKMPSDFDIKFGNLCNLKCRMCNAGSSSQIAKEVFANWNLVEKQEYPYSENYNLDPSKGPLPNFEYYDSPNFINSMEATKDDLVHLKFTGGEPLLIKQMFKFLKQLIDKNLSKNISLHFVTNLTKLTREMMQDYFSKFAQVTFSVSLDGYKSSYEYIRYPAKWSTIEKNIDILKEYNHNIDVNFSVCFDIYNCISYLETHNWIEQISKKHKFNKYNSNKAHSQSVDPIFIDNPSWLDVRNLPLTVKEKLYKMYDKNIFKNELKYIQSTSTKDSNTSMKDFVKYTNTVDKVRGQSFKQSCPQEWELVKEYFNGSE